EHRVPKEVGLFQLSRSRFVLDLNLAGPKPTFHRPQVKCNDSGHVDGYSLARENKPSLDRFKIAIIVVELEFEELARPRRPRIPDLETHLPPLPVELRERLRIRSL